MVAYNFRFMIKDSYDMSFFSSSLEDWRNGNISFLRLVQPVRHSNYSLTEIKNVLESKGNYK